MTPLPAQLRSHLSPVDGRGAPRRTLQLEAASSRHAGGVLIHNLSRTGLMIETDADLTVGDTFEVILPSSGPSTARVVWARDSRFGCEFLAPVSQGTVSAALLRSPIESPAPAAAPSRIPAAEPDRDEPVSSPSTLESYLAAGSLIVLLFAAILFAATLLWLPLSA